MPPVATQAAAAVGLALDLQAWDDARIYKIDRALIASIEPLLEWRKRKEPRVLLGAIYGTLTFKLAYHAFYREVARVRNYLLRTLQYGLTDARM